VFTLPRNATPYTRVEVFGDKHAIGTMMAWASRASNSIPAFEAIHEYMIGVIKEQFDSEGASGEHGPWEPRIEGTRGPDHPLLQASGDLMRAWTDANDPHHIFVPTPTGFAMGVDIDYSDVHQSGSEANNTPQRRIVDFTQGNREVILGMLSSWIVSAGLQPVGGMGWRMRGARGRFIG
jgi:hypothetical protein